MSGAQPGSIIPGEIGKFNRLAAEWWDPAGPMRPLHAMNPLRVGWIDARIRAHFGAPRRLLDVGCGAGLAAEALARLGHDVLGIDAAADVIAAARAHAAGQGLKLAYREGTAESLLGGRAGAPETESASQSPGAARFSVVTALEVIEHVASPAAFLRLLAALLEPDGLLFVSTINRTLRSLAVAKIGAEYVARLLPAGTHDWRRFVTPAELGRAGAAAGLRLAATQGMRYDPGARAWRGSADLSVNYLAVLQRA